MLTLVFLPSLLFLPRARSHPQCLDYQPPFEPSSALQLCTQYQTFGCCETDAEIKTKYDELLTTLSANDRLQCGSYIRDILCQKCSPYAAHAYDAEDSGRANQFPLLCPDYAERFRQQCGNLELGFGSVASSTSRYCYPNILRAENAQNLGTFNVNGDNQGCIELCVQEVVNSTFNPTSAKHSGDGSNRLFVLEQRGVVNLYFSNFTKSPEPFLDIRPDVYSSNRKYDERGLLDIAFHPDYQHNGKLYVYYTHLTNSQHVARLSQFRVSAADPNKADPDSERVLLEIPQVASNHNGGTILFRERLLYVFTGDGGLGGDPQNHSQTLSSLLGKVLRIDVEGGEGYAVPPGNPFLNVTDARPEIYAYGLRNPWRCSVDRGHPDTGEGAGRILCGDVGQNSYEEVDLIVKGANYGWRPWEANTCFRADECAALTQHERPIDVYGRGVGISVTGGYVYRGCQSPNLQGHYIFGDWHRGRLFSLRQQQGAWVRTPICMGGDDICVNGGLTNQRARYLASFAEDESGEIYLLQSSESRQNSRSGKIYKLVDPARRGNPATCRGGMQLPHPFPRPAPTVPTAPTTGLELAYRLTNRWGFAFVGRVEVRHLPAGEWGLICGAARWTTREALVVCRALGFRRVRGAYTKPLFAPPGGEPRVTTVWLDAVRCRGDEVSLGECENRGWGVYDGGACTPRRAASVYCGR